MEGLTVAGRATARPGRVLASRGLFGLLVALAAIALCASPALATPGAHSGQDRKLVDRYAASEGAKLGVSLPGGAGRFIELRESPKSSIATPSGRALAATECRDANGTHTGPAARCVIELADAAHHNGELRGTVAYQVFQVFEAVMSQTLRRYEHRPSWLLRGAGMWVRSELVHDDAAARRAWTRYLQSPATPLFSRGYDAVGFFGHMASTGLSPWKRLRRMLRAPSSAAAYAVAVRASEPFLDSEASVFFREPAFGAEWDAQGANVPSSVEVGFKPTAVNVTVDTDETLLVKPHADGVYELSVASLTSTTPVLELTAIKGDMRLRATSGGRVDAVDNDTRMALCSYLEGCLCPDNRSDFLNFEQGDLAITGATTGGEVRLVARQPCEVLLAEHSCEGLLPGFKAAVQTGSGKSAVKPLGTESSAPDGSVTSTCAAQRKGSEVGGAFVGVTATSLSVKRYPSVALAAQGFTTITAPAGFQVSHPARIGNEADLFTGSEANASGELEGASIGAVRVRNLIAQFSLSATPGSSEASGAAAQALLAQVAYGI